MADNIFKQLATNSRQTAKHWDSDRKTSEVVARTCPTCGAPRPVNTNVGRCSYCSFDFMSVERRVDAELPDDKQ